MDDQQANLKLAESQVELLLPMVRHLYAELQFLRNELLAVAADPASVQEPPLRHCGQIGIEVQRAVEKIRTGITARSVVGELKRSGYPFVGQRPVCNVGNVLKRFVAAGILVKVESGSGRSPARYDLGGKKA